MVIGILGGGMVGKILAKQFIKAGNSVVISNSRGPDSLRPVITELGSGAAAGTVAEAAKQDIVLLAMPWEKVTNALASLSPWSGRILIDATNQFNSAPSVTESKNIEHSLRGSELVASLAPDARVIKAFNTLFGEYMDGETPNGRRVLFYAGDDAGAKRTVAELFSSMNYFPVDVGNLSDGNRLMQLGGILSGTHFVQPFNEKINMSKVIIAYEAGNPNVFQFENEVVDEPNKGEVKIAQKAIGINYADVLVRKGQLPMEMSQFPLVDGFDAAGIVTEVGEDVAGINVGDRVAYFLQIGAYREVRNMPIDVVVPIPDDVTFDAATTLLTKGLTAKMLVQELQPIVEPGNYTVMVQGATGGVATLVIRLLKSMGITVIGLVSSEAKKEMALATGADAVMLYNEKDIVERVKSITGGKWVDASIDGVGAATLSLSVEVLKDGGKLVSYGTLSGPITAEQVEKLAKGKAVTFITGQVGDYVETAGGISSAASEIFTLIEKGIYDCGQVQTYAFEEITMVHTMMERRQTMGDICLKL